ncbi:DUF5455 family protein [Kushneria aurantia]|uniref:DUF5455 family protein n=1 Tax=Kushneria aurantia TaxID=504092 RepID=A0ABV6G2A7_9GAMM|nr:DUF5455 family protein [Kushneria aurantia]
MIGFIGLILRLVPRFGVLLEAAFFSFAQLAVRFFLWFQVVRFGWLLVKIGLLGTFITIMATAIDALIGTLVVSMPPMLSDGISRILPENFSTCVSAIIMAKFAVFTLQVKDRVLSLGGV